MNEKLASSQPAERSVPVQALPSSTSVKLSEPLSVSERIKQVQQAINLRAFELFNGDGATHGRDLEHWAQAESELFHPMHLNVVESENSFTAKAELPGFTASEIQVILEPRRLSISGSRESSSSDKQGKVLYEEHCSSETFRSVELPQEVDTYRTQATLKDGVLEVVMPKTAEAKTTEAKSADVQAKAASSGAA